MMEKEIKQQNITSTEKQEVKKKIVIMWNDGHRDEVFACDIDSAIQLLGSQSSVHGGIDYYREQYI